MAAPVYQSVTNVDYTSVTTAVAVPVPASVAVGDLLAAEIVTSGGAGVTSLSGWTDVPGVGAMIVANNPRSRVQYRIADGTEGATQTWTIGSATAHGSMVRITGAHATTPFPVNGTKEDVGGTPTTFVVPEFTTLVADCLLISGGACNSTTVTFTQPSTQGGAWTEIVDSGQAGGAGKSCCMAYQPVAWAAGATGTMTVTISGGRAGQAWMAAVAPAAAVTPTTAALVLTTFAPTVLAPRLVTPTTAALVLTTFAPTVATPSLVTPTTAALVLTTFAPTVATPSLVTPTTAALVLTTFAPEVTAASPSTIIPGSVALVLTTFAPTVLTPSLLTPGVATLTLATFAPTVLVDMRLVPAAAALVLTGFAPTVTVAAAGFARRMMVGFGR